MGIPRLSQDLHPYTERVVLGQPQQTSLAVDASSVQTLIIDGPSVVYFVYNKLLAYKSLGSAPAAVAVLTYEEINRASQYFLHQLTRYGVDTRNIFFDGGLPEAKRGVRLLRMERLRQQLEAYRKAQPETFPIVGSPVDLDLETALWNTPVMSTRKFTLPAPPFMVASVIERLRASDEWKDRVQIVPGEADLFCAQAAKDSGAAILTNDSDLAVHDLGSDGRIVLLQSIEKTVVGRNTAVTALALNPRQMAQRLDVSSLLRFGFERSIDPSLSVSLVRERARDESRLDKYRTEYTVFAEPYLAVVPVNSSSLPALNSIDPRTAELIVDMKTNTPHIYLTPLVEDPSRDSSWSYGADLRQMAYSLLGSKSTMVTEYARKGQRIAATTVLALHPSKLRDCLSETLQLLLDHGLSSPKDHNSMLKWYSLAFGIIFQQKLDAGKTTPKVSQILRLLGLTVSSTSRLSWDDVHLLANTHAVLYSLRMLQQITGYVLNNRKNNGLPASRGENHSVHTAPGTVSHDNEGDLVEVVEQLYECLNLMPEIEHLFLDIPHLRRHVGTLDLETRDTTIVHLKCILEAADDEATPNTPVQSTNILTPGDTIGPHSLDASDVERSQEASSHDDDDDDGQDWTTTNPKKKRKIEQKANTRPSTRSANLFDLLMEAD